MAGSESATTQTTNESRPETSSGAAKTSPQPPVAKAVLADEGYDPVYGARPLKRRIQQRLQNELANRLLAGDFHEGDKITIDVQNGDFTFST